MGLGSTFLAIFFLVRSLFIEDGMPLNDTLKSKEKKLQAT
jgi:hypothetical protein